MAITIDTHALIWYMDLELNSKLSSSAFASIKDAEAKSIIYIPIIVMIELLYLYEKGRINISFSDTLDKIEGSQNYQIVPLEVSLLKIAESIKGLETHDRLILATAYSKKTL